MDVRRLRQLVCAVLVALGPVGFAEEETEDHTKPVTRVFSLEQAGIDRQLKGRLENFLSVYGKVIVDQDRSLVVVQTGEENLPMIESFLEALDHRSSGPYLVRLVWLRAGVPEGDAPTPELEEATAFLAELGVEGLLVTGQLVLRVAPGVQFATSGYPVVERGTAGNLQMSGTVKSVGKARVEAKLNLSFSSAAERRRGGSSTSISTSSTLALGVPVVVSTSAQGEATSVLVLKVEEAAPRVSQPHSSRSVIRRGSARIQLHVDGADTLKIRGNEVWLEHHSHRKPGRIGLFRERGSLPNDNAVYINGTAWLPEWRGETTTRFACAGTLLPSSARAVKVTRESGRGVITVEQPEEANDFTASIHIDDGPHPGTSFYDLVVGWSIRRRAE